MMALKTNSTTMFGRQLINLFEHIIEIDNDLLRFRVFVNNWNFRARRLPAHYLSLLRTKYVPSLNTPQNIFLENQN